MDVRWILGTAGMRTNLLPRAALRFVEEVIGDFFKWIPPPVDTYWTLYHVQAWDYTGAMKAGPS